MWLAIEGLVGAGKTTTTELVSGETGLHGVIERSEEHPFLEAYYRDPERYAIETEIAFMLLQVHQVRDLHPAGNLVSDFSPAKNLIFARTNCTEEDQRFLERLDARLWADLPRPDLAVLLDVPVETCLARIASRGRSYEQGIRTADLERLRTEYLSSLETLGVAVELIVLDGTESREDVATAVTQLAGVG